MQCAALLRSGRRCGREAAAGAQLCAYHGSLEFRGRARAFSLARLSAEDLGGLAEAARVEGIDAEIAVLRVLMRRAVAAGNLEGFLRGMESLVRALRTQRELDKAEASDRLGPTLEAVLEKLGQEEADTLPTRSLASAEEAEKDAAQEAAAAVVSGPSAVLSEYSAAAKLGAGGADSPWWIGGEGAPRGAASAGPEAEGAGRAGATTSYPVREVEAAWLALRFQRGDTQAFELLHELLQVTVLAMLLEHQASATPGAPSLEERVGLSRGVLANLALRWRPVGSFLAYFLRAFPSAMSRAVREAGSPEPNLAAASTVVGVPEGPFSAADLAHLPDLDRQIVFLRAFEGLSIRAITAQLGISAVTAHRKYARARGRLGQERQPPDRRSIGMGRLVQALHIAALPNGRLPNREWAEAAAGLTRDEYQQLIGQLEGAGAIRGRRQRQPGYLVERTAEATLARVGVKGADG